MATLYTGIKQLLTFAGDNSARGGALQSEIGLIEDGAVLVSGSAIAAAGKRGDIEKLNQAKSADIIDMSGALCIPAFADSHTHSLFAAPRLNDFSLRIKGVSYSDIARSGGGISGALAALRKASKLSLQTRLLGFARRFIENGTASVEIKSGYGLNAESELKMLEVIAASAKRTPLSMVPTLLAAHSLPPEFKGQADKYLEYINREIFPIVSMRKLAVFADIFCERGFFTPEQLKFYLKSASGYGFKLKAHTEQLSRTGGTMAAAACGAVTVDHTDYCAAEDIAAMQTAGTIATLLPASNYFLGLTRYPPARDFISAAIPIAIATDFNPGTAPCLNMQFIISCACINCALTPEEALCAATVNGARAMGLYDRGIISPGMRADLAFFDCQDYRELAYYFGGNLCIRTIIGGKDVYIKH